MKKFSYLKTTNELDEGQINHVVGQVERRKAQQARWAKLKKVDTKIEVQ